MSVDAVQNVLGVELQATESFGWGGFCARWCLDYRVGDCTEYGQLLPFLFSSFNMLFLCFNSILLGNVWVGFGAKSFSSVLGMTRVCSQASTTRTTVFVHLSLTGFNPSSSCLEGLFHPPLCCFQFRRRSSRFCVTGCIYCLFEYKRCRCANFGLGGRRADDEEHGLSMAGRGWLLIRNESSSSRDLSLNHK